MPSDSQSNYSLESRAVSRMPFDSLSSRGDVGVPAFSPILDAEIMKTASVFPTEAIPANHILLAQDERPRFVRLIRSGIVQLVHSDKGGGESILGLRSEGWWAGGTLAALGCQVSARLKR